MRKFGFFLLASLTFFSATLAFSKEKGGGASNGGNAILCDGKPAEMIDTFLEQGIRGSSHPFTFRNDVYARLVLANRDLADAWQKEWERIGNSKYWQNDTAAKLLSFDEYLPYDLRQVKGCRAIQVASFTPNDYMPKKVLGNYDLLSEFQRRVLELHESLFVVGVRDFEHTNPVMTRELIAELLSEKFSLERARMLASTFAKKEDSDSYWHRDWRLGESGIYALDQSSYGDFCPAKLVFEDTRVAGSHLIADFTGHSNGPKNAFLAVRVGENRTYGGIQQSISTGTMTAEKAEVSMSTPEYQFFFSLHRLPGDLLHADFTYRTPDGNEHSTVGLCVYHFQDLDVFKAREIIRSRVRAERLKEIAFGTRPLTGR